MRTSRRGLWPAGMVFTLLSVIVSACASTSDPVDCSVGQDARQLFVCDETCWPGDRLETLGFAWNGYACSPILMGCHHGGCEGVDCDDLFPTLAGCRAAYEACGGSCGPRLADVRDEVPTHPICRATPTPSPDWPADAFGDCLRDDDCAAGVNGQCRNLSEAPDYRLVCSYDECFRDTDCPAGRVCAPVYEADPREHAQSTLHCIEAACTSTDDCDAGERCTLADSMYWTQIPFSANYRYGCGDHVRCGPDAPATLYRITALTIPTLADVGSAALGHNVDGAGDVCGVTDYADGVDNALLELSTALQDLEATSPLSLPAEIDAALACVSPSPECEPLDLVVALQRCEYTLVVSVRNAQGETLAGPGTAAVNGNRFRLTLASSSLSIPIRTSAGVRPLDLSLTNVVLEGAIDDDTYSLVIGGALLTDDTVNAFASVLDGLAEGPSSEDMEALLVASSDVQSGGECRALSVGLRATAVLVP